MQYLKMWSLINDINESELRLASRTLFKNTKVIVSIDEKSVQILAREWKLNYDPYRFFFIHTSYCKIPGLVHKLIIYVINMWIKIIKFNINTKGFRKINLFFYILLYKQHYMTKIFINQYFRLIRTHFMRITNIMQIEQIKVYINASYPYKNI